MTQLPVGGPAATTYRVTSSAHVTGRVAVPAYLVTDGRAVEGGPSQQVYYVSDAEIAAGEFIVAGDVHPIPIVAANNINTEYPPIPIYVVNPPSNSISPYILVDTFADANGTALASHTPDVGAFVWSAALGTWNIQSNRANIAAMGAGNLADAVIDIGVSDYTLTVVMNNSFVSAGVLPGVTVRYVDGLNHWIVTQYANAFRIYENNGGTLTERASVANVVANSVDCVIQVVLSGTSITATIDGANQITYSSSLHQTATKISLHAFNAQAATIRFDNLQVRV